MKTVYLAQMKWPEWEEPICVGTNLRKVAQAALKMMKEKHGTGPVDRPGAMCSLPIIMSDIEVTVVPVFE